GRMLPHTGLFLLWKVALQMRIRRRLNMGIRDFDAAYGGLNVVGESLLDDGVLNQALASNPPRGWVHSENPQDAADLWNGNNKAEAVFWTNGNLRLAGEFPALEGYSHSVSKADINHIKKRTRRRAGRGSAWADCNYRQRYCPHS
ncbi:hypothetical protein QP328_12105, partial [Neisseria mucosa]|nr:hypothetical protein [Neisseria mucosa]MDK6871820.1 hypothetical protein [Neisseria mucosa]